MTVAYAFDRTGTHKYLRTSGTPPNWYETPNFTVSLWFRLADVVNNHCLIRMEHTGTNERFRLEARGDVAGDPVRFTSQVGGVDYAVNTPTGYSANAWHHVLAILLRNTSELFISLDGAAPTGVGSVKVPTTALSYFQVSGDNAFIPAAIGSIADVALWPWHVWDGGVGSEKGSASLAKGFSPMRAQPKGILGYWPLVRELVDRRGGHTLTAYNSPTVSDHPRVIG